MIIAVDRINSAQSVISAVACDSIMIKKVMLNSMITYYTVRTNNISTNINKYNNKVHLY